jgi:hyperosmotically inducible protein
VKRKHLRTALVAGMLVFGGSLAVAQSQTPAPDNTKVNQRDRSKAEQTADNAKNNVSDRDLMQQIRKAIVDDKDLSTNAHNIKVIAKNGKVTLKGPVDSAEEKKAVEQKATDVAGAGNVTNQVTVKAAREKKDKKDKTTS